MFKKAYFKIGLVVLLLAALMLTFGVMLAQADDADNYFVTVTYAEGCETVYLSYNDGTKQPMTSGTAYKVPKTATNVKLELVLERGYALKSAVGNNGDDYFERSTVYNYGVGLISDDSITIECVEKTYTISYQDSKEGSYHLEGYKPTQHTFGQTDTKISIPTLDGYVFRGWIVLPTADTDPSTITDRLTPAAGADYVLFPSGQTPEGDTIYLIPAWEEKKYPVYRVDAIYSGDPNAPVQENLNSSKDNPYGDMWEEKAGVLVSGAGGNATVYPGYYFDAEITEKNSITVKPYDSGSADKNVVYRYYRPYEYVLDYQCMFGGTISFPTDATAPSKHVFNTETVIPIPLLTGYDFDSWKVEIFDSTGKAIEVSTTVLLVDGKGQLHLPAGAQELASEEYQAADGTTVPRTIRLTAQWKAKQYQVSFDWNGADESDIDFSKQDYSTYIYDQDLIIPDPIRKGYTFTGWKLIDSSQKEVELKSENGQTVLTAKTYTGDVTLVAQWTANQYTVTLNGNGADSDKQGTTTVTVTFDSAWKLPASFVFPQRTGYTFAGFSLDPEGNEMYTNANGEPLAAYPIWNIDKDTTLYAQWTINQYKVSVNVVNATVTVIDVTNDKTYTYNAAEELFFDYGTTLRIVVAANSGYKVVKWEGANVTHAATYEYQFVLGAQDTTLTGTVLQIISAPTFKIDYIKETIITETGTLPDGHYLITCGGETLDVYVSGGKVTINQGPQDTEIDLPESFHGKTISIVTYGVDGESANSDAQSIAVAARPAKPEMNNGREIDSVYQDEDTSIVIQMTNPADIGLYEFACSENADGTGLTWKSASELTSPKEGAVMFEDLKPGAKYYIYIRKKAVADQHAHGLENCIEQVTKSDATLDATKRELLALIQDSDGEMVQKLIDAAIAEANALERPSPTFSQKLEGIYNRVSTEIKFAREQDAKIAALTQLHKTLVESGEFNTSGVNTLNTIYGIGVETIKNATASDDVQRAYNQAVADMGAVLITHLVYGDMELTSEAGLPQGTKLFGSRLENIGNLISSVDAAIQAGNISVGGVQMTLAEATEALRTLDVMAAYQMKLTSGNVAFTAFDGGYEIRLLLPAELRGVSGLQVAYYNEKTGELEVLDTEKDGNCLVFKASRIADFVILGDPTMNLNGFIGALLVILICQLIAIILLLARRARSAKNARRYSLMLPALLTIRFLPDNGFTIVLVLGGLVILFQIILMYLLLTSDVVYRRKRRKQEPAVYEKAEEETLPVMAEAQTEEEYAAEEEATDTDAVMLPLTDAELTDGDAYEATEDYSEEDYEAPDDEGDAFAVFSEDGDVTDTEDYAEEQEEEDAYDDFIEPAANPRYSLPDEDEMFVDTETGEIYSAEDIAEAEAEGVHFTYDDEYEDIPAEEAVETILTEDTTEETTRWQYDDTEADLPEAETEYASEETPVEEATEEATEEVVEEADETETENAFYEEPDARGDTAPAPDDFYYDPEEETKKYDGYEE